MRCAVFAVLIGSLLAACGGADFNGTPLAGQDFDAATTSPDGGAACDPTPAPAPQDPSTLPTCCMDGAAHCVDGKKVSASQAAQLSSCGTGGYCVPDVFIKNPSAAPPTCKSLNDADGVCLSLCVPQVGQFKTLLPQATCAADERCAPCINPLTKASSGACDIGKTPRCGGDDAGTHTSGDAAIQCPYTGPPLVDPKTLPSCNASGGAHCIDKALVPAQMASQLAACPTGLCAPDSFITTGGNFIPATCDSLVGAEGRCLHVAIPQVAQQKSQLPQSTCAAYERCVPCYSPLDGVDTSACHLSCDPGPKRGKKLFQDCCSKEARCIPSTSIPAEEQKSLKTDSCTDPGTLCVPSEMLGKTFTPPTCTGNGFLSGQYSGVCLSKCLKFSFIQQIGIDHGDCTGDHDCVPCTNPLTQQPTGAPGCP